jgi:hypothetical protein
VRRSGPSNVPALKFRIFAAGGWFQKLEREFPTPELTVANVGYSAI